MDLFGDAHIPVRRARERGHAMAEAAADRADRAIEGWTLMAVDAMRRFAAAQTGLFTIEMARMVLERELPKPTDGRAWGKVTTMAKRAEYIEPVRNTYFPAASSNGSPKPVYRRGAKTLQVAS